MLTYALAAAVGVLSAAVLLTQRAMRRLATEAFDHRLRYFDIQDRLSEALGAIEDAAIPLGWAYTQNQNVYPQAEPQARMRAYLGSIYQYIQHALDRTDVDMAELRDRAALVDPPRRMPKYPNIPPYLATPEDVAGVSGMISTPTPISLDQAAEFAEKWRETYGEDWGAITLPSGAEQVNAEIKDAERALAADGTALVATTLSVTYQTSEGIARSMDLPTGHYLAESFQRGLTWIQILYRGDHYILPIDVADGETVSIKNPNEENHWWPFVVIQRWDDGQEAPWPWEPRPETVVGVRDKRRAR